MRFMDVNDGRFIHVLEDAWNEAKKGTDKARYSAFLLLRESRILLETAKGMGLFFPGEEKAKAMEENLRTGFLNSVESMLILQLDQADKQTNRIDKIRSQFQAIRMLGMALAACQSPERASQKKGLEKIYKDRLSRFVALGGTLDFAEKEVESSQDMDSSMVVEILQGCVIWHQTAHVRGGEETLEVLLKTHARQHSDLLFKEAQLASTSEQAAHDAVRSLKLFAVGHGMLPVDRFQKVWPLIEPAIENALSKSTLHSSILSSEDFFKKRVAVDYRFWFVPKSLENRHQNWLDQERERLLNARMDTVQSASKSQNGLHKQVSILEAGIQELSGQMPEENPLRDTRNALIETAVEKVISRSEQKTGFENRLVVLETGLGDLSRYLKPDNRLAQEIQQLLSEFVSGCVERSRSESFLSQKIKILMDGIAQLGIHKKAGEVLQQRLKTVQALDTTLRELATSAQSALNTKHYLTTGKAFEKGSEMLRSFATHHQETVTSSYLDKLEQLDKQSRQAIEQRERIVLEIQQAGFTPQGWKKAVTLLTSEPGLQPIEQLRGDIEAKYSLHCDPLIIKSGSKRVVWFARDQFTMAREGGDVPLSLQGASGEPKVMAFEWKNGQASVTDRNSTYGLFLALPVGASGSLQRRGIHYNRMLPNTPIPLDGEGELVIGHWARLLFHTMPFGVVFSFLEPFSPKEVDPRYGEAPIETVWPDWREEIQQTILLAPKGFSFATSREGVKPVAHSGELSLEHAENGFVVRSLNSTILEVEGFSMKSCPVMSGFNYRIGKNELRFEGGKNHAQ